MAFSVFSKRFDSEESWPGFEPYCSHFVNASGRIKSKPLANGQRF
jgi:hypothetical protein